MNKVLRPLCLTVMGALFLVFACVTINIYFPAEKVESVAGEIVHDIRGGEQKKAPKDDKTSSVAETLMAALLPSSAWAQDATTVSNPTIRALKEKLKNDYNQMKPYYAKGILKEGGNGYVSLGSTAGLGLKEVRDLKALVDAENQYRRQLYEEVAKALKIDPSQVNKVAEIFAKEWQKSVR